MKINKPNIITVIGVTMILISICMFNMKKEYLFECYGYGCLEVAETRRRLRISEYN